MAQSLDMSDGLTRPPLPDFADPPVVEVALGVQFQPPVELSPLDLGPLRERWRDRFPRLEQQPPLPPVVEAERASQLGVQVVVGAAPMVRQWFLAEEGRELIQLQQDRLIVNWRDVDGQVPYPRYEHVAALFAEASEALWNFLAEQNLPQPSVTQAEVNYINAIRVPDGLGDLGRVFSWWSSPAEHGHQLGNPEEATAGMIFRVRDMGSGPVRMYVDVQPADTTQGRVLLMTLTVRGAPADTSRVSAIEFMGQGRAHIVNGFSEMTTAEMHEVWGRRS